MIELIEGTVQDVLPTLGDCLFDACLTDPPYGLGFMGKEWDHGVPGVEVWREVCRVLKPGAMLMAFGGTRTHHRLMCAIEDVGFEIRDTLMWLTGQGFPKSKNFGCKCSGNPLPYNHEETTEPEAERHVRSMWKKDLPAPIDPEDKRREVLLAGVPEQSAPTSWYSTGAGLNETREQPGVARGGVHRTREGLPNDTDARSPESASKRLRVGAHLGSREDAGEGTKTGGGSTSPECQREDQQCPVESENLRLSQGTLGNGASSTDGVCPTCGGVKAFKGYGSCLKPAWEPIILAMKTCEGTFAENALKWGVAGLAINAGRIETADSLNGGAYAEKGERQPMPGDERTGAALGMLQPGKVVGKRFEQPVGRWPANLLLDEEAAAQLDMQSGTLKSGAWDGNRNTPKTKNTFGEYQSKCEDGKTGDSGGASRFFYVAKAGRSERGEDNNHPTVKPLKLCEYLAHLLLPPTPPRTILVPFSGSGSEAIACHLAGWDLVVAVECSPEYAAICRARMAERGVG